MFKQTVPYMRPYRVFHLHEALEYVTYISSQVYVSFIKLQYTECFHGLIMYDCFQDHTLKDNITQITKNAGITEELTKVLD